MVDRVMCWNNNGVVNGTEVGRWGGLGSRDYLPRSKAAHAVEFIDISIPSHFATTNLIRAD